MTGKRRSGAAGGRRETRAARARAGAGGYGEAGGYKGDAHGRQGEREETRRSALDRSVIVRWREQAEVAVPGGQAGGAELWNANANAVEALGTAELARRLKREGLPEALGQDGAQTGPGAVGMYRVAVCGLEEAVVWPPLDGYPRLGPLDRRLRRASARALFVLGLDAGTVTWRLGRTGKTGVITAISPRWPKADRETERRLREAFERIAEERTGAVAPAAVVLGADPEFALVSPSGKIVPASRYFEPAASAGTDTVVVGGAVLRPLGELRPEPDAEPRTVAARLRALLAEASRRASEAGAPAGLRWLAGASPVRGLPLGGHLHVSGAALTSERLRALDNAVALPLRLLEPAGAGKRRPRYGSLGDCRPKAHGGFEYRTPPSWLVSPRLAVSALALAKVAAEHARELAVRGWPLDEDGMRDAFYSGDRAMLTAGVRRVYESLRLTAGYARYREDIDWVFEAVFAGRQWDEGADIRAKWKVPTTTETRRGGLGASGAGGVWSGRQGRSLSKPPVRVE